MEEAGRGVHIAVSRDRLALVGVLFGTLKTLVPFSIGGLWLRGDV